MSFSVLHVIVELHICGKTCCLSDSSQLIFRAGASSLFAVKGEYSLTCDVQVVSVVICGCGIGRCMSSVVRGNFCTNALGAFCKIALPPILHSSHDGVLMLLL